MNHKEFNSVAIPVSNYLQARKIEFRFDIADGLLTKPQAIRMKKLQGKDSKGFPDCQILKACNGYNGMFIELKTCYSDVFKKDGTYKKKMVYKKIGTKNVPVYDHIQEQVKKQNKLKSLGYYVVWGFGYTDTIEKIEEYLNGNIKNDKKIQSFID